MGMVKEIQTVLDNIAHDVAAAGIRGQLFEDSVREEAKIYGVSDYFINQYMEDVGAFNHINKDMYDG
jgi:hypothetical protein